MKNVMFKPYKFLSALLLAMTSLHTLAAATKIEDFGTQTWQLMQKDLPRPAAVVFSTTDCGHCPAIIAALAEQLKTRKPHVPLVVVVMDGNGQTGLLQESHYLPASRLFIFKGQTAALQYGINANWRGITPYVALLPHKGKIQMIMGKPSSEAIKYWLDTPKK